jgi:glycine amidinotransferase
VASDLAAGGLKQRPVVCSHNEWDPLEELIVGRVEGAAVPPWHVTLMSATPQRSWDLLKVLSGQPAPPQFVDAARREMDEFIRILQSEGITVRRPDSISQTASFSTPDWTSESGYNLGNPRDGLLVIGDEILETPMAWRSRYFEVHANRSLLHEYFQAGAKWTAAPKPRLADTLYDEDYQVPRKNELPRFSTGESEMVFDAADFIRCGRDIFAIRSNTTNEFGIEWLRRHLGDQYDLHVIPTRCPQPMHIDTTLMPLAPGKALVNPEFLDVDQLPAILKKWELRAAPRPVPGASQLVDLSSAWLSMNVLMLDPRRVVVEATQEPLIKLLADWGFEPIPCPFNNFAVYGGAFHCATLDVRRRGTLESYFD